MQWLKDKVGRSGSGVPDNQLIVGSDKWMGSTTSPIAPAGSFKNPASAQRAVENQSSDSQPNPYVQNSEQIDSSSSAKHLSKDPSKKALYPQVYNGKDGGMEEEEVDVVTASQVLVTIPGAVVHLIDDEESVHLATGDFSLVRLFQEKTKLVVLVKVGEDLKWPLVQQEPAVKIDPTHYFFTLKVPKDIIDDDDSSASKAHKTSDAAAAPEVNILNYGVTFPAGLGDDQASRIRELDYFLERYSTFSAPTVVHGDRIDKEQREEIASEEKAIQDPNFPGKVVSATTLAGDGQEVANEETSAAFWTTIAPQVDDYNSSVAKGIAKGAGHIIRGIFWVGDSWEKNLSSGNLYMKSKFKPKKDKSQIRAVTTGSVRTVRKLSGMTDSVAKGVLGGILTVTNFVSSAVVNSRPGQAFFRHLPGEVILVSLDAFGSVFDAIEVAGTGVVTKSSTVTQDFVDYRYGESAKELTDESFRAVGHAASTMWTLTKIRKALNPTRVSKTGIAKNVAGAAIASTKKA